jgi:hypothetical protein
MEPLLGWGATARSSMMTEMLGTDTTPEAAAAQAAAHARLGPGGRFAAALELSELVRDLARSGIRARHPEYSPAQVEAELLRALYGGPSSGT